MVTLNVDWDKVEKFVYELDDDGTKLTYTKEFCDDLDYEESFNRTWSLCGKNWSTVISESTILSLIDGLKTQKKYSQAVIDKDKIDKLLLQLNLDRVKDLNDYLSKLTQETKKELATRVRHDSQFDKILDAVEKMEEQSQKCGMQFHMWLDKKINGANKDRQGNTKATPIKERFEDRVARECSSLYSRYQKWKKKK